MSIELYAVIAALLVAIGVLALSTRALKKASAKLAEAISYYERSNEIWDAIDKAPTDAITGKAEGLIEAFLSEETDQTGSIASDYQGPA